jgi:UDP-N-acetylmuramate: L-alanyl-gamma-D-glutamyl-meso-diaminopimelate ligase
MRIHILGICGTFMAGIAVLAKQLGHEVVGSDEHVYPPMSTQLQAQGITLLEGFDPIHLNPTPDVVIIGNVMKRGNPCVEYVLNYHLPYISAPQWLAENVLRDRWTLAVAGTHGKTTTTSILTWILEYAGLKPSFLIGGIPNNFEVSARVEHSPFFVIEGDEYDSAFFDKRSKFIHYRPRTVILNNLEYDHADIFPNLDAIKLQFHHLVRTIPHNGLIITPMNDVNLNQVLAMGCWTPVENFGDQSGLWSVENMSSDGSKFEVIHNHRNFGSVEWSMIGKHNVDNAIAAIAAAQHAGVPIETSIAALNSFMGVKRRLEVKGQLQGITVYDDFAHHPTAIAATLAALRARVRDARIIVVVEFGSYTMRYGCHGDSIISALQDADYVLMLRPKEQAQWNIDDIAAELHKPARAHENIDSIIKDIISQAHLGDHVLIMSNKGFDGIHEKLLKALQTQRLSETRSPFFIE